ncbi:MAG: hypothetical protein ACUVSK_14375 [Desulfotomaculales bacterium]
MKTKKVRAAFCIELEDFALLKTVAKTKKKTVSEVIREILKDSIGNRAVRPENRLQKIEIAILRDEMQKVKNELTAVISFRFNELSDEVKNCQAKITDALKELELMRFEIGNEKKQEKSFF